LRSSPFEDDQYQSVSFDEETIEGYKSTRYELHISLNSIQNSIYKTILQNKRQKIPYNRKIIIKDTDENPMNDLKGDILKESAPADILPQQPPASVLLLALNNNFMSVFA